MNNKKDICSRPSHAFNWKGERVEIKWPKGHIIATMENAGIFIVFEKKNTFAVIYGLQVKSGLSYEQAVKEFGECVMHSAQSEY